MNAAGCLTEVLLVVHVAEAKQGIEVSPGIRSDTQAICHQNILF